MNPMSRASTSKPRCRSREPSHERPHHLQPAAGADADRHADQHFPRPHRDDLHRHDDASPHRIGRPEAVHGHREVGNHGRALLHPGRQLPHARRCRAADDQFRDVDGRPLPWRPGARVHPGLLDVRAGLRLVGRHRGCHRFHRAAGHGGPRLPDALRCRRHHHGRLARHPDAAVHPQGHLRDLDQHLHRRAVRRRPAARHRAGADAGRGDLVDRPQEQLPAPGPGRLGRSLPGLPQELLGPAARRHHRRRHLVGRLHGDRGRGDGGGVLVLRGHLRLQGPEAVGRAQGAARLGQYVRDAALHHHERGAVLLRADQ
mmetsp:Transcript_8582/g.16533  ORF Transcript_8582/g.16533 Transcript_8582/m.16533 type:complete len:315 (+) Transcript_8582:673-1617(+)